MGGSILSFVFNKPTGGIAHRIGYPPGGVGNGPIELITAGYPPFEVSYGWDTRRSADILILSILTLLSYQPDLAYRIGICPIYCMRYRPGEVFYGSDTFQAEYEVVLSNWKPRATHLAEYPIWFSYPLVSGNSYAARWLSNP